MDWYSINPNLVLACSIRRDTPFHCVFKFEQNILRNNSPPWIRHSEPGEAEPCGAAQTSTACCVSQTSHFEEEIKNFNSSDSDSNLLNACTLYCYNETCGYAGCDFHVLYPDKCRKPSDLPDYDYLMARVAGLLALLAFVVITVGLVLILCWCRRARSTKGREGDRSNIVSCARGTEVGASNRGFECEDDFRKRPENRPSTDISRNSGEDAYTYIVDEAHTQPESLPASADGGAEPANDKTADVMIRNRKLPSVPAQTEDGTTSEPTQQSAPEPQRSVYDLAKNPWNEETATALTRDKIEAASEEMPNMCEHYFTLKEDAATRDEPVDTPQVELRVHQSGDFQYSTLNPADRVSSKRSSYATGYTSLASLRGFENTPGSRVCSYIEQEKLDQWFAMERELVAMGNRQVEESTQYFVLEEEAGNDGGEERAKEEHTL